DRDGQFWIGSLSSGLVRLTPRRIESCRLDPAGNMDVIRSLLEIEQGVFWAGTLGAGLWRWEAVRAEPVAASPGSTPIGYGNVMLRSRDGSVWLGSEPVDQLHQFRDGRCVASVHVSNGSDSVLALAEDTDGTLWTGCTSGRLYRLRDGKAELFK